MSRISQLFLSASLLMFLGIGAQEVFAQTGIEGTVVEATTNGPLPGATVQVQDTGAGTATDADGNFEFDGLEPGTYTVTATFVGYIQAEEVVEVQAGQMTEVELRLARDEAQLDELVVRGYSVQPRREVTGSMTSIDGDDFELRSIQSPDQALQGRSAGLQMQMSSGEPGGGSYVRIRGVASIDGGNTPLFIVDGVPLTQESLGGASQTSFNPLGNINPSDVESIEVLRDAEATAIYGAQGANGVILITTRSGVAGDTEFTFRSQYGRSHQTGFFDTMDSPTWVNFMAEAWENHARDQGNDPEAARQEAFEAFGYPDEVESYDWQRILHQEGHQYRANLSATGGSEDTQFFIAGNYNTQEGTVIGSGTQRYGFRSNVDHQATDRLSFEVRMNVAERHSDGLVQDGGNYINSPFHGGPSKRPTTAPYTTGPDGNQIYNQDIPGVLYNLLQVQEQETQESRTTSGIGNLAAMYQFSPNFLLRATAGGEYRNNRDHGVRPGSIPRYANSYQGGRIYDSSREIWNWNTNLVLNYNQRFDDIHNVTGLIGGEYQQMYRDRHFLYTEGLPNEFFTTSQMTTEASSWSGSRSEYRKQGVFSRLTYNYDQRYFVSGNARYDGHSRFGSDQRYGLFWSGALAWDVSQEPFMSGVDWVDQLRPRASYGITGNASLGSNYPAMTLYGSGGTYEGSAGLRPTNLGNANLTWEQARTTDLAIDASLFQGRVTGSAGVYRTDNERLLLDRFLPLDSGFSGITDNVGTVRNEGIELELGIVPLNVGDFIWRSDFNITFQRSEILDLGTNPDGSVRQQVSNSVQLGEPRHIWWGREYAGVNPANGRPMFWTYDDDGNDVLDYEATSSDYRNIGSYIPDYFGGWNNTFAYGPVSLDVFFQYEYGSDVNNITYQPFLMDPSRQRALSNEMLNRWQQPGDMTHIPMAYREANIRGGTPHSFWSSLRIDDGSYIRLKSLTLRYELPEAMTEVVRLNRASIFTQGENLLTWTGYRGPDPEIVSEQQSSYPQPRQFTIGIEVSF